MYERINERVAVYAIFRNTNPSVHPYAIKWRGRQRLITQIGYVYKYTEGKTLIHVVAVTDGTNFYELILDSHKLTWTIGRIAT